MTGRQATNSDDQRRARPRSRRVWARRGGSVLALAACVFAALTAVQALGGPGLSVQAAFATPTGHCLPKTATKIEGPGDNAVLNAAAGEVITPLSIKAGTECFITPTGATGTVTFDDCYLIEGLATAEVTVRRIGDGPGCKEISHIQFVTAPAGEPSPELCGDALDNDGDGIVDDGCIGDRAWDDANYNAIQDAGEPGLAGVTFELYTDAATLVASTVSDANGTYYFRDVPSGTYFMRAIGPPGHPAATGGDAGTDDALDSDFGGDRTTSPLNDTPTFSFSADTSIDHLDAGFTPILND